MVWPGANNQLDYNTVPDIQKYYLDGSNIHIVLIIPTGKLDHLRLRVECTLFCNIQSRARNHAVLVIGLYELLGNPTT
jgi:hypothetical protein